MTCGDFNLGGLMYDWTDYVDIRNLIHSFPSLRNFIMECYENSNMDPLWHLLECLEFDGRMAA